MQKRNRESGETNAGLRAAATKSAGNFAAVYADRELKITPGIAGQVKEKTAMERSGIRCPWTVIAKR